MTKYDVELRIKKLRKEINHHRYLYHVLDRQELSDAALDSLKHELARLEEQYPDLITPDSPTQRVSGKPLDKFQKVRHRVRMTSLHDAFSEEELRDWEIRIQKFATSYSPRSSFGGAGKPQATSSEYFAEAKGDGFAISLVYQNGVLAAGATRGDGMVGEDVTQNVKTIESVPLRLEEEVNDVSEKNKEIREILRAFPRVKKAVSHIPATIEVRGEIYMEKKVFEGINRAQEKKGLPKFANPRNVAAGSVRQLDPKMTASRRLSFFAWDLVGELGQQTHEEEHLIMKVLGLPVVPLSKRCKNLEEVVHFQKEVGKKRERLPYLIDGIVVQVNDNIAFERLGIVGKAPRGAVAFKWPGVEATTIVRDITVQIGRTGVLTPVAILEPVAVGGVTVSRATLHNMDEINRLHVRVGDTVIIQRAGDVIPDIVRVLENLRPAGVKKFHMPRSFCEQRVVRKEGESAHKILHPEKCALVARERFYHFVSKSAFDIEGLGPKIVDRLIDERLAQDPADLFLLKEGDLKPLERFQEKSAENLIYAIHAKTEVELSRFIQALGILHVGEETAIDLVEHFGTLEALQKAPLDDLETVPNIGGVVARSIYEWFHRKVNREFLKKLFRAGVRPKSHKPQATSHKLKGKTFVLTGSLENMSRDEAKARIRALGGEMSESVSKKTSYVVVGADPGSKQEKAKQLGVTVINEKTFLKLL
jgi:DNA ligase (NAD+)